MRNKLAAKVVMWGLLFALMGSGSAKADELYGTIRGVVSDPSGAVIAGAKVTATNAATGFSKTVTSASDGSFSVIQLPAPQNYDVAVEMSGFKTFKATHLRLALTQIYVLDVRMEVGQVTQQVTVEAAPAQVEKSSMELGASITGLQITDLPLNGRNWVQLQQTLPGVQNSSDRFGTNFSTNGQRTQANGFTINGIDANDLPLNTPLVIPNPDAIAEVRFITNTINPEYGRNSGVISNAVTKSGTNHFHGDTFEFYRDTALNTRNFFTPKKVVFHQHQFGATIGGPIKRDRAFGFFSYQGTRNRAPQASANPTVFTPDQRNGIFPDIATSTTGSPFPLTGEPKSTVCPNTTCPAGTPYNKIFPTGSIPLADFNPISQNLLKQFVPLPNSPSGSFAFNPISTNSTNQFISRFDVNVTPKDSLFFYWFNQRNIQASDLPFIGANLPGFASVSTSSIRNFALSWNHTLSPTMLNEARLGYNRFNFDAVEPQTPVLPSSLGFNINPQSGPRGAGLPFIDLTGFFTLGFSQDGPQPRLDQTIQAADNFTVIKGKHTLKFGFDLRASQVENPFFFGNNGDFDFGGSGAFTTGNPGADFLLGIPDDFFQSSGGFIDARTREYYSYAQDQFRVRPNLTLIAGMGWQINTPINDIFNGGVAINAFRPGQQSTVFPSAPTGLLFPGDFGVTTSGFRTRYQHLAPRFGFAWGFRDKWSLRGGWGIFYNNIEEETTLQNLLAPPFSLIDFGASDVGGTPGFANPFVDIAGRTGLSSIQKFPFTAPKPGAPVDFSFFEPFSLNVFDPNLTTPSAQNYNVTLERQLPLDTVLSIAYVGSFGRHLENTFELNPAGRSPGVNPACAANPACVATRTIQGITFPGNFKFPGDIFGSIGQQATDSNSNYNSLQVTADKHFSHGLQLRAAWTYSHAIDDSSSFEQSGLANPFLRRESNRGDSRFDARNRFVISYVYQLPSAKRWMFRSLPSRLTDGWQINGITTFTQGFPIQLTDSSPRALICNSAFSFFGCPDRPDIVGPVNIVSVQNSSLVNKTRNPKNTRAQNHFFFDPNSFAREPFGRIGNVGRDIFHGPNFHNFDFAVFKSTKITETTSIQLRVEFFNLLNRANFNNPVGNINSGNFGRVLTAKDPRFIQLAGKFIF